MLRLSGKPIIDSLPRQVLMIICENRAKSRIAKDHHYETKHKEETLNNLQIIRHQ